MTLKNFTDISRLDTDLSAGFQFEFSCEHCHRNWRSPFQPYRRGQIAGLLAKVAPFMRLNFRVSHAAVGVSQAGVRGAREQALAEAIALAQKLYTSCPQCQKDVCADCFDNGRQVCASCIEQARSQSRKDQALHGSSSAAASAAPRCPNCQTPNGGGRFCAECGFDMASTHKSCPGCGAMQLRQARFCTDCGHGF